MHNASVKPKTQVIKGVTYVYQEFSYRVKGAKHPKHKRRYLGKHIDGQFIPNASYWLLPEDEKAQLGLTPPVPAASPGTHAALPKLPAAVRLFYGATYLFDELSAHLGVTADLQVCFPGIWEQMLSVAWFLILEERTPLSRFPRWGKTHRHPYGKDITSPRSSELFGMISEDAMQQFFSLQIKRRLEREYLAYDSTSICTFSKALKLARRGKNKEHDLLDQIHLALVFGQESRLPVCFRILPGNISDVSTVRNLVRSLVSLGIEKVHLVMDRSYYSEQNINVLLQQRYKFLIGGKTSLNYVKDAVNEVRHCIGDFSHYHPQLDVYAATKLLKWQISQVNGEPEFRRVYLHLYYSEQRSTEDRRALHQKVYKLKTELETGCRDASHANLYAHYFIIKAYPKRAIAVTLRKGVLEKEAQYFGYFALMTNDVKNAAEALRIYRAKDVAEKAFGNLKERLGLRRPGVSSDANLPGKIFVQYIALILCSYIQNIMRKQELYQQYSYYSLLDELDVIEYYEHTGTQE